MRLAALLQSPDVRLLTLVGPGGIGKTRLASEVAVTLDAAFPDGVVFVSLAATNDPTRVPAMIAQALGLQPRGDIPVADAVSNAFTDLRILLVLDNLEHLLPAGLFLATLLQVHPRLTILATSRTRLDLNGEQVYPLDPLNADDARALFHQRASAQRGGRELSDDGRTIDALCTRLDRLPLAIELAAARTATFSPQALLERLSQPLTILRHGPRDVPLRQQTMRDTIAWSYDLLDAPLRDAFCRFAVFMGGFPLEAARAVIGQDQDALDLLEFLVARSLVVPMASESGQPRFTMLESIRQYGVEMFVASGEEETVRNAHADAMIRLMQGNAPQLEGPGYREGIMRLHDELENARAAILWALARRDGKRANLLTGLAWKAWLLGDAQWSTRSVWSDRLDEIAAYLVAALALRQDVASEHLIDSLGAMPLAVPDTIGYPELAAGLDELQARSEATGSTFGIYVAHFSRAQACHEVGDWPRARAHYASALEAAGNTIFADTKRAETWSEIGRMELEAGDLNTARTAMLTALDFCHRSGQPYFTAKVETFLAIIAMHRGDTWEAARHAMASLGPMAESVELSRSQASTLVLADVALANHLPHEAVSILAYATTLPQFSLSDVIDDARRKPFRVSLPETDFGAAWEEGLRLTPPDIRAIGKRVVAAAESQQPTPPPTPLTTRELEVVRLLVEGLTNRAIGERLFISERTVERHVLNVMTKLDLGSRTAVVVWAVRADVASTPERGSPRS